MKPDAVCGARGGGREDLVGRGQLKKVHLQTNTYLGAVDHLLFMILLK
jgi:hypothetical protein